jgi:ABC-type multidrug transport system permease subunit
MAKRSNPLLQLTLWRVREFLREPEALFWVFAFPVLMTFALGLAFKNRGPQPVKIAVQRHAGAAELAAALDSTKVVRAIVLDSSEARQQLRTGKVTLVLVPGLGVTMIYDSTREDAVRSRLVVDDQLQRINGRHDAVMVNQVKVTEVGSRYVDFLLPGLLGMNIMGTGMWSIGFYIVRTRSNRLLKRLLATPMSKPQFVMAQMTSRLWFLGLEAGALLLFGYLAFGIGIHGSIVSLALLILLGATSFAGLGVLIASRAKTIEGVSGLMNVTMMPMWILSGVFFSASNFPDAMQPFIKLLPLTALNDAMRAVMTDGATLASQAGPIAVMAVWGIVTFGVALKIFRWS